jgi:hypothetical protein
VTRFRNTEIITVRKDRIVEVYSGWSIPHEAPAGRFNDEKQAEKQRL